MAGRTVKIYLKEGTPNSLLIAEILTWTGKVFVLPRSQLVKIANRLEIRHTGLYILVGRDLNEITRERVYIGESDNVWLRLNQHNDDPDQDFWDRTIIICSKDENLTKAHARYLESRLISLAQQSRRASLANSNSPPNPQLPESDIDDMEFYLEQIQILLPVLGFSFLQSLPSSEVLRDITDNRANPSEEKFASSPLFFINFANGEVAEAREINGEFVVLQGSRAIKKESRAIQKAYVTLRKQLQMEGKLKDDGQNELLIFTEDVPFSSVSTAASVVRGTQSNGRTAWKVKGSTLTYKDWQQKQIEDIVIDVKQ